MDISYPEDLILHKWRWRRDGGKTPFEKLKDLGYDLPWEFALFPSVILDTISTSWLLETGNELLAHYNNE